MAVKVVSFNFRKALEAIVYIATKAPSATMHSTSKILYFADKAHLRQYGRLICGDEYVAMRNGPVPSSIYDIFKIAGGRKSFDESRQQLILSAFSIKNEYEIKPLRETNADYLSASEIECIDSAINEYGGFSFDALSNISHDAAWESADRNNVMSLESIVKTLPNSEEVLEHISS